MPSYGQRRVAFGDVDGDRNLDVVEKIGLLAVVRGNGDGSFAAQQYYDVDVSFKDTGVADANGDGHLDIVEGGGPTATVLFGRCLP